MWSDCLSQNVQCHSLAVVHRKRCDLTAFHKYPILSLTCYWLYERMWWDCLSQDVLCHSQSVAQKEVSKFSCSKSLTFFRSGISIMSFEKKCNWLSFSRVFHMKSSHVTKESHTSCLFYNNLWNIFDRQTYLLSIVLGQQVMWADKEEMWLTIYY